MHQVNTVALLQEPVEDRARSVSIIKTVTAIHRLICSATNKPARAEKKRVAEVHAQNMQIALPVGFFTEIGPLIRSMLVSQSVSQSVHPTVRQQRKSGQEVAVLSFNAIHKESTVRIRPKTAC